MILVFFSQLGHQQIRNNFFIKKMAGEERVKETSNPFSRINQSQVVAVEKGRK